MRYTPITRPFASNESCLIRSNVDIGTLIQMGNLKYKIGGR